MKKFLILFFIILLTTANAFAEECNSATQCAITGKQLLDIKDYNAAIECFNRAIMFDENEYFSYAYRAKTYYYLKDYIQAEKDAEKSLSIKPNSTAFGMRATLRLMEGNYRDAIDNATDAIALNPEYMKCYEVRARAKVGVEEYFEALKDISKAIKLCDYYPKNYEVQAMAYMGLKDYRTAFVNFEKAAELFKANGDRKNYIKMKKSARNCRKRIKQ